MVRSSRMWAVAFLTPVIVMFGFMYAVPLARVAYTSLFDWKLTSRGMQFVGLDNFTRLFTADRTFLVALKNTGVWLVLHVFLHVAIGVLMALVLYRKPRGWKVVRTVYMAPNIIAASAMALIFKQVYNADYGLLNTFLRGVGLGALARNWLFHPSTAFWSLTMTWFLFAGYTCTLVLARLLSISSDLFEAARIDGCNTLQVDFHIALPIAKDTIATTMIMAASYMLTMFPLIYLTTGGGPGNLTTNLPLYLYNKAMIENNYGYANAIGVFIIVCGIAIMRVINRTMRVHGED